MENKDQRAAAPHNCPWKPGEVMPCPYPLCQNGVPGFFLIVPVPADAMDPVRGRFGGPRWPDKRYRRVRHSSEREVWFSWMEEDLYERQYAAAQGEEK